MDDMKLSLAYQQLIDNGGITADQAQFEVMQKLQEEVGELFQAWLMHTGRGRDKGQTPDELKEMLASETADVLGMIMIFASMQGVDLNKYIKKKWRFEVDEDDGR